MKFIALLLTVIVLTLTVKPCCTAEEEQVQKESKSAATADECCKDCSPFYVCGTCVGFTTANNVFSNLGIYLKPTLHHSVYLTKLLAPIHSPIWQPPKIS